MSRRRLGQPGVKILDATTVPADHLPRCGVFTDGRTHDLTVIKTPSLAPGDL
jgi:hypothetical protein